MKTSKLLLVLALVSPVCWAADTQALAEKLMELSGTETAMNQGFEMGFQPVLKQMKAQGMPDDLLAQITEASHAFFAENFKWSDVKPEFAKLYTKTFSESELNDLVKFYESPTGQKAAAKLPTLMQEGAAISMSRIQSKMPEFQQKVMALIQDYRDKHAPAAAPATAAPSAPSATTPSAAAAAPGSAPEPSTAKP